MNVLITGSGGFIGRHLVAAAPTGWNTDSATLDFDLAIHCAAHVKVAESRTKPSIDVKSLDALTSVLECFRIKRFVFLSSGAVYDGLAGGVHPRVPVAPLLPYAVCKYAAERLIKHAQKIGQIEEYAILRLFGAYGPGEASHKLPTRLLNASESLTLAGTGNNLIDLMYIDDCVRAILTVAESDLNNITLDLARRQPVSIREFARQVRPDVALKFSGDASEPIQFFSTCNLYRQYFGEPTWTLLEEGIAWLKESL